MFNDEQKAALEARRAALEDSLCGESMGDDARADILDEISEIEEKLGVWRRARGLS